MVWSDQMRGDAEDVPRARALMPDPRARHFWDGDRFAGRSFQSLPHGEDTIRGDDALWDVWLLFASDARWKQGEPPPAPVWWEHQLQGMPPERRLDAKRFAAKAMELVATAQH
ncbi:MAG: hypothetical protein NDJ75_08855 [Thermoanaerobaculia bacterium]|nr:hypothetical protein [Thermoanaerobaculia bacterium]